LALYFLDASALTKLYVREPGTDAMLGLAGEGDVRLALLSVTAVELRSAVRRRERLGDIPSDVADSILAEFASHLESRFMRQPITEGILELALTFVDRHALRAYDALQLAGCSVVKSTIGDLVFLCADQALCRAAVSEEVSVINPEVVRS
jgi:predicted nucleic acid-binding protein